MSVLKANVAKSIEDLRRTAAGGGRGTSTRSIQLFLKADTSVKVRFLQEPTEFVEFFEHYDKEQRMFVPAIDNDPLDNHPNEKVRATSRRWMANILNVEDGRVHLVKISQDLMNRLLTRYQRCQTLTDRNYEIIRDGGGVDTKYDLESDEPTKVDLVKFRASMHDIEEYLLGEVDKYHNTNHRESYLEEKNAQKASDVKLDKEPTPTPAPTTAEDKKAKAQAELDAKYGVDPPWSDEDDDDGIPFGKAETSAPAGDTVQVTLDPWAVAKAKGQPCAKGEDDTCVICGFPVENCLMAK